jgi:hypothetical protein
MLPSRMPEASGGSCRRADTVETATGAEASRVWAGVTAGEGEPPPPEPQPGRRRAATRPEMEMATGLRPQPVLEGERE